MEQLAALDPQKRRANKSILQHAWIYDGAMASLAVLLDDLVPVELDLFFWHDEMVMSLAWKTNLPFVKLCDWLIVEGISAKVWLMEHSQRVAVEVQNEVALLQRDLTS